MLLPGIVAAVACAIAAVWDLRRGIIPNWLTAATGAVGAGLLVYEFGYLGLIPALGGALAGGVVPLVLAWRGAMGGGDVKMLMALGALLGTTWVLQVEMAAFGAGAVWGVGKWVKNGELGARLRNALRPARRKVAMEPSTIRFAPAILVGVLASWLVVR